MSEGILKALMQLFAIIAPPDSNAAERRSVVGSFLKQQLNQELIDEYLKVFDEYYTLFQKKQSVKKKRNKSISVSSVKILKICTQINDELTQKQKVIVVLRLLEFIKSDFEEITEQELEFVYTVADTFYIDLEEYNRLKAFVLYSFDEVPNSTRVIIIDSNKEFEHKKVKHMHIPSLEGQIRIFSVGSANMYLLRYLGESEITLNGIILRQDKVYVLNQGSSLRSSKIKPIYYSDIISLYHYNESDTKISFEIKNIEYRFKNGGIGLNDMSFCEESGKLVGIMGASGAGKSTLLNVLNGTSKPTSGAVLINGINIYEESDKIEGLIGNVSQDDLLIEELTVFQNLYYNAKLCFGGLSEFQILRKVLKTLNNLGLFEKKDMVVGSPMNKKISGGQRKRLNIALELIREPAILFLDEPTSGLSSRDSENILDLLKELTLKGKLIFVVIHQPSSDIFKMFDNLIILDTGGFLIYDGDPVDSIMYFKSRTHQANWSESECRVCGNVNSEQVFNLVESHVLDEYGNITQTRKIAPKEWNVQYLDNDTEKKNTLEDKKEEKKDYTNHELPSINFKIPSKFKQFRVFVIRDILSKIANKQYLFINILEAPILAFFLAYLIRYYDVDVHNNLGYTFGDNNNIPVYLFMAVIVAIFIGLTVSAEEIIKDQLILKRERFLNLSWASYLFSKVAILLGISAIQALLFILVGNSIIGIQGMYWQYWLVLFTVWSISTMFGLNISNSFKTAVTIYILIPFLVIPNIILSGIIVKYDKLNPDVSSPSGIPIYGELIPARWAYEALAVYQYKENNYEKQFYVYDKVASVSNFKKDYWVKELQQKANACKKNISASNDSIKQLLANNLELLYNEISQENEVNKKVKFKFLDELNINNYKLTSDKNLKEYFKNITTYYKKKGNKAISEKDKIVSKYHKTEQGKNDFLMLKKNYQNESLKELVKNDNDLNRIVEYNNRLYQKLDPIFQEPESSFVKAHFYAPTKNMFGLKLDTFWMNIIVLWFGSLVLFITLYFKLFKRLLDSIEKLTEKVFKSND